MPERRSCLSFRDQLVAERHGQASWAKKSVHGRPKPRGRLRRRGRRRDGVGVETLLQNAFDHGVAGLLVRQSPRARGFEAPRRVLVGEVEDAERGAQPIERALAEQPADQLARVRADLPGAAETPGRGRHEGPDLVGRHVIGVRVPPAGPARPRMRRHHGVLVKQRDSGVGGADPQRPRRCRR